MESWKVKEKEEEKEAKQSKGGGGLLFEKEVGESRACMDWTCPVARLGVCIESHYKVTHYYPPIYLLLLSHYKPLVEC